MNKKEIETAFIKSIPIMCSYLFGRNGILLNLVFEMYPGRSIA